MPRSAGLPSTSSNGLLEPSFQPQNRKESAPARLGFSREYDDPLAAGPSAQQPRKDGRARQGSATSPSITLSGFLGLSGSKLKKQPAQGSDMRQVRSNPGSEVVDPGLEAGQEYTHVQPGRPRAGTYDPSSASSIGNSNRSRGYTLSSSTATSSGLTVPPTPATSYDGDGSFGGRGRSNSASSTAASFSRKGKQAPSLRAVEEYTYDPFAAGNTSSFYNAPPTPPMMTPDSQYFVQPDPQLLRRNGSSSGYVEGTFGPKTTSPNPTVINNLRIPQRPTVQIPLQPTITPSRLPISPSATNPLSTGPLSKKQPPLLPFRSKSTRDKKSAPEESESHSGFINGLLRPNSNRHSGNSAVSAPSDVTRSGSVVERSRLLSSPRDPAHRLPVSIGNSPADFKRSLASPTPSIISSNYDDPSPGQDTSASENVPGLTLSEMSDMATSASTPATSPSQPSSDGHPSRHLPTDSAASPSMNGRRNRLRAALAVSVQDIDTSPLNQKGGEYDISDLRIEVDVSELSPASSISKGKERSLGVDSALDTELRPRASPVVGEEGTFEFLLPPKSPAIRIVKTSKDSPQYGAPSFIEESCHSPGDHYFFASPYPSGVTTVPVFRESMDLQRDSGEQVRPPEGDLLAPPKVSIESVPGDPANGSVAEALLPPTPNIISDFPSVPDLFHDIEVLMSGGKSLTLPQPRTLLTPRPPIPSPVDPVLPVPDSPATVPSPPKTAATIQPSLPPLTINTPVKSVVSMVGMSPLKIADKATTVSPSLTAPAPLPPRTQSPQRPLPFPPAPEPVETAKEPTLSAVTSPTVSDIVLSPIEYRPNPLMKNPAAASSTLSFSSASSAGAGSRMQSGERKGSGDAVLDQDSDVDAVDLGSKSSSRRRRGSEPASPRPRVGMDDQPFGTSFGALGTQPSIMSSSPPSAFPAGLNGILTSRKRSIPTPSSYQRTRSPSTGSSRGRNMCNFMSNLVSSSVAMSEDGAVTGGSPSSFGILNGRNTPSSSAGSGTTSPPGPKRMRSFNHIPIPPMPSLRHYNSFNPSLSTPSESSTPPSSVGSVAAQKVVHTSASTSNLSMASSAKTEVGPVRKSSTTSKHRILSSKTSICNSRPSTAGSVSIGPLGETVDYEHDWSRHRARFPRDDDTRSLVTLNRPTGSLDIHRDSMDEIPSTCNESVTVLDESESSKPSGSKTNTTTSPSKADFGTPLHIMPPSELLRLGDSLNNKVAKDEDTLSRKFRAMSDDDSLIHGDFDDMSSTLRDPEGSNWLSDVGVYAGASSFNPKTTSVMGVYEGRGLVGVAPGLRGFPRPSTSSRRDSSVSKSSSMTGASRRPSISQVSSSNSSGVRTPGGPLSPPPPRSRLPRSSISSSIRSFGTALPHSTPLAPHPARSRANSGSEMSQRANANPPPAYPRRGSAFSVLSTTSSVRSMPLADTRIPPQKAIVNRNPSLTLTGMSALRKKRQSLKPSFLDIEFDDDMEEEEEVETRTLNGGTARGSLEDSFLDLGRGTSMDSIRD
ncbi:hypothetical protein FRB90_000559 [Tulasnella sp. 427]|nr:hypothetical protein FRB90_000559 [Tulasnella sp. 427]